MIKSASLLIATNFAVVLVLGFVTTVLQQAGIISATPGQLLPMFLMSLVMGFGGAVVSLFMSKSAAVRSTRAKIIQQPENEMEEWIVTTVQRQAQQAGIKMPDVAIYDDGTMNAFATGPSKNNSLVAVSTGLMHGMTRDEVEGVLAHEISHAANGDMVAMTLVQGVMNTFVLVLAQILGGVIDGMLSGGRNGGRRGRGPFYMMIYMALQGVLGVGAGIIVKWFSRQREYRADAGAANLAGADKMIAALQRLKSSEPPQLPASISAMGINGGKGLAALMATHPSLDSRIATLQAAR